MPPQNIRIAIVDDHALFRAAVVNLITSFDTSYSIVLEAENGQDLLNKIQWQEIPDILIMDLNMPKMDGFDLARYLQRDYPDIRIIVVSMFSTEANIIRMLRLGIKGYLSKDIDPQVLHNAIESVNNNGYHFTDFITGKLLDSLPQTDDADTIPESLTDKEILFLQLACSEDTYQEIADKMFMSVKTIDGYRASVFDKLKIKSRAGLVLYSIKSGLVKV